MTGKPLCSLYSDLAFLQVDACLKGLVAQASSSRLPKVSHAQNVTEKALVLTFLRFGILTRCLYMTESICALGVWPAPFVTTRSEPLCLSSFGRLAGYHTQTPLRLKLSPFGRLAGTNPFAFHVVLVRRRCASFDTCDTPKVPRNTFDTFDTLKSRRCPDLLSYSDIRKECPPRDTTSFVTVPRGERR